MSHRCFAALLTVIAVVLLAPVPVTGQAPTAAVDQPTPPRTPWGEPDLQGVWDFRTATPLERPESLAGKKVLSDEDAAAVIELTAERWRRVGEGSDTDPGAYNQFWFDYGTKVTDDRRSSLLVDPPDGRIPSLTPDAQRRVDARRARRREHPADSWEDRGISERCILGFNAGPPMDPSAYNNNMQLFQTPDHVVIFNEMVNDSRVIPLDGRAHLPDDVRQWRGESRGRWDGDTLIVETRNFTDKTSFRGTGPGMRLVERFTRVSAEQLLYEYTIDDPESFGRTWSVAVPMTLAEHPIYEYACHEGNYGMEGILAGARADERAAARAAK